MMNFLPNFGLWLFDVFLFAIEINIYEYFNFHLGQHPPPQAAASPLEGRLILKGGVGCWTFGRQRGGDTY